ncbi:unnamed protein product [Prorocentrum cordatum]|uniref:Reverse transcriptase Ty1/copia-type domain-containing protein n=1 Tax=Prorocentrum cordatum TaxID=2364126 RepID=A0ABN9UIB1_9DINO|nr:unnamed protein product [Polarella glacialis]
MYGFVHAPRKWWLDFKESLNKLKLEAIQCEPRVWVIRDGDGKLIGTVILHVDDMTIAGDHTNKSILRKRKEIQQAFEWTPCESKASVQCGVSIRQNNHFTCSPAQDTYSMNVEPIPAKRGRKPTDGVSDRERSDLRGRLGNVGWRAQQSAPWLSAEVSLLQAENPTATVSTIQKIYKLIRAANDTAVQMMTETLDDISYVQLLIYELECGHVDYTNKQAVNDAISTCPGVLVTVGKSGYETIEKSESAGLGVRDKRTGIECLGIRQQKQQTGLHIRWVHSDAMLADGLTKDCAAKALLEFFRSGQRWRLVDDPLHRLARKRESEGIDKLDHGTPLDPDTAL